VAIPRVAKDPGFCFFTSTAEADALP